MFFYLIKKSLLTLLILFLLATCGVYPAFSYIEQHVNKRDNIFEPDEILIATSENIDTSQKPKDSSYICSDDNSMLSQCNYNFDEKNLGNINLKNYRHDNRILLPVIDYDKDEEKSLSADNSEQTDNSRKVNNSEEEKTGDSGEEKKEEPNTGENPVKPKTRFELRFKYQNLSDDRDVLALTFRGDKVFDLDNRWAVALRFDFPLLYNDVSPSGAGPAENYKFGSSDLVSQILFIPPRNGHFDIGFGVQFMFPLGSDTQFGRGKYIIAPVFGAVYVPSSLPKGSFCGCILRNEFSYAGNENRRDVNELVIQPYFNLMLPDRWFIATAPGMRINWEQNNSFFLPVDLTVGKLVGQNKTISIRASAGVIKDYNYYDYDLEFTTAIYF